MVAAAVLLLGINGIALKAGSFFSGGEEVDRFALFAILVQAAIFIEVIVNDVLYVLITGRPQAKLFRLLARHSYFLGALLLFYVLYSVFWNGLFVYQSAVSGSGTHPIVVIVTAITIFLFVWMGILLKQLLFNYGRVSTFSAEIFEGGKGTVRFGNIRLKCILLSVLFVISVLAIAVGVITEAGFYNSFNRNLTAGISGMGFCLILMVKNILIMKVFDDFNAALAITL